MGSLCAKRITAFGVSLQLDKKMGLLRGRSNWFFRGREDKAFADQGEALLGEFGLQVLVVVSAEKVGFIAGDGGDQVMRGDGLAVQSAVFVGVGCQLNRLDGAGLLGK